MVAPAAALPPPLQVRSNCRTALSEFAEIITQIAIRVLFIGISILMAGAAFPVYFHAVVLPPVALSTTLLAGSFFLKPKQVSAPYFKPMPPLIVPVEPNPPLPIGAPRGLRNVGNNCAFNALVHFFQSDPQVAHWLRNLLPPEPNEEGIRNFLGAYNMPADHFIAQFQAQDLPLNEFIENYVPEPDQVAPFRRVKDIYTQLNQLYLPFSRFFEYYDAAVQVNRSVAQADTQRLRVALSQITDSISPSMNRQVEAADVMGLIFSLLPDAQKISIRTNRYLGAAGNVEPERNVVSTPEKTSHIPLEFQKDDPAPTLQRMFDHERDHGNNEPYGGFPVNRVTIDFVEVPTALRFKLKRFAIEPSPVTWLTRWLPSYFPQPPWRETKINTPVQVPQEFQITVNGEVKNYRLASFVTHLGADNSGHYIAKSAGGPNWKRRIRLDRNY